MLIVNKPFSDFREEKMHISFLGTCFSGYILVSYCFSGYILVGWCFSGYILVGWWVGWLVSWLVGWS